VYNGIDLALYPFQKSAGSDLIFLGRIHSDKGVHLAILVARLSGFSLLGNHPKAANGYHLKSGQQKN